MTCQKRSFTFREANMVLVDAKIAQAFRPHNTRRHETRIYHCRECDAYHLTSKPKPDWTERKEPA